MAYLKVILISLVFIIAPTHGFSVDSGNRPVTEEKSSAMKELKQRYSHDHKMQRADTHTKKVVQHPKTNSSWTKKQSSQ